MSTVPSLGQTISLSLKKAKVVETALKTWVQKAGVSMGQAPRLVKEVPLSQQVIFI
jgi:hypothetical protein